MAYAGTTAASSLSNPPMVLVGPLGGVGNRGYTRSVWLYSSADASSSVAAAGYFTDGAALGMQVGDLVCCIQQTSAGTTSYPVSWGAIGSVVASSAASLTALTS